MDYFKNNWIFEFPNFLPWKRKQNKRWRFQWKLVDELNFLKLLLLCWTVCGRWRHYVPTLRHNVDHLRWHNTVQLSWLELCNIVADDVRVGISFDFFGNNHIRQMCCRARGVSHKALHRCLRGVEPLDFGRRIPIGDKAFRGADLIEWIQSEARGRLDSGGGAETGSEHLRRLHRNAMAFALTLLQAGNIEEVTSDGQARRPIPLERRRFSVGHVYCFAEVPASSGDGFILKMLAVC